tara:strand:- start:3038 stop:4762 length:1725 start_codon:yes stop_codon:yes gene_type:complete
MELRKIVDFPNTIIAIVVLFVHWPLLFSTSILGDSIINYELMMRNEHEALFQFYLNYGLPIHGALLYLFSFLKPILFVHKLISFLSIYFIGIYMHKSLNLFKLFSHLQVLLIVTLCLTFPVFSIWTELTTQPYLVSYAFFWVGYYFLFKPKLKLLAFTQAPIQYALGLVFLSLSFQMYSLVFHFWGLYLIYIFVFHKKEISIRNRINTVFKDWWILIFPLFVYIAIKLLTPALYQYNEIHISLKRFVKNCIISLYGVFIEPLTYFINFIERDFFSFLYILGYSTLIVLAFLLLFKRISINHQVKIHKVHIWSFVLLLFLSVLPYLLINKPIRGYAYESRHSLLLALPIALLVFTCLNSIKRKNLQLLFMGFTLLVFSCIAFKNYVLWENRSIKIKSIAYHLNQMPELSSNPVFFYDRLYLGNEFKIKNIELDFAIRQAWQIKHKNALLLNKDFYTHIKRLYLKPIDWSEVLLIPWLKENAKDKEFAIDDEILTKVQSYNTENLGSKLDRTYLDLAISFTDLRKANNNVQSVAIVEISPSKAWQELRLFVSYTFGNVEEKEEILKSLINLNVHDV